MSEDIHELQALIQSAQQGSETAFEALLTRYETTVFRYVYTILGNRADAEDVTQEVFIKLWRTLPRYRFHASFSTYLTRIARNAAHDFLRAHRKDRHIISLYAEDDDGEEQALLLPDPDPASDPVSWYLTEENVARLHDAMLQLPDEMREVLMLRAGHGHSYEEIAAMLSISEGTVKSRLHRAKKYLRKILENGNFLGSKFV